jgi:hypothetical protein
MIDNDKILSILKEEVILNSKENFISLVVEEFKPILHDFLSIRNPSFEGEYQDSEESILEAFKEFISGDFDKNISVTNDGISIGVGDKEALGFGLTDFSTSESLSGFKWVYPYIDGTRSEYIFLNAEKIPSLLFDLVDSKAISREEVGFYLDRLNFYTGVSPQSLELRRSGKLLLFAGGVLIEPDFFFQDGWDKVLSPEYFSSNIETGYKFLENVSNRISEENIFQTAIENTIKRIQGDLVDGII